MPQNSDEIWSARCRDALSQYAEPLLRTVAAKLIKPRVNQPPEELLDKSIATLGNPPVIDRRIRDLSEPARKLLAVIGLSRQQRWKVGHLITLVSALGHSEGFAPVAEALTAGLLFPELPPGHPPLEDFASWFGSVGMLAAEVFAHPAVSIRARGEELGLPDLGSPESPPGSPRITDGLDWLLRLAAAWQQVHANPVRFTQANTLFERPDAAPDRRIALGTKPRCARANRRGRGALTALGGRCRVARRRSRRAARGTVPGVVGRTAAGHARGSVRGDDAGRNVGSARGLHPQ
ncbi:MAG: hypothetical protein U0792_13905 [Gemmataceae bacterium]